MTVIAILICLTLNLFALFDPAHMYDRSTHFQSNYQWGLVTASTAFGLTPANTWVSASLGDSAIPVNDNRSNPIIWADKRFYYARCGSGSNQIFSFAFGSCSSGCTGSQQPPNLVTTHYLTNHPPYLVTMNIRIVKSHARYSTSTSKDAEITHMFSAFVWFACISYAFRGGRVVCMATMAFRWACGSARVKKHLARKRPDRWTCRIRLYLHFLIIYF